MSNRMFVFAACMLLICSSTVYSASIMPFDKFETYIARTNELQTQILSPKEFQLLYANDVTVFKKVFVQPMSDLGYSYNDTMCYYAKMLANQEYPMAQMVPVNMLVRLGARPACAIELLKDGTIDSTTLEALKLLPEFRSELNQIAAAQTQKSSTTTTSATQAVSIEQNSGPYKDFCGVWIDNEAQEELVTLFLSNTESFVATRGGESDLSFPVKIEQFNDTSMTISFDLTMSKFHEASLRRAII